jgi:hypothetical protein
MSDQSITITLSRRDAAMLSNLAEDGWAEADSLAKMFKPGRYADEKTRIVTEGRRVINLLDAALAAAGEHDEIAANSQETRLTEG